jgi:hypothetical protein
MTGRNSAGMRSIAGVVVAALLLTAVLVIGEIAVQPRDCCAGRHPYASVYNRPVPQVDVVLVSGDGQAFGALAQDPLLRHPERIGGGAAEYSYRAQRAVWAALAWAGSVGQPELVGWVLALLTILSAGAAAAAAALLLTRRGSSPWWALLVLVCGIESIFEFTPELLAFALLGFAVLAWTERRPWPAALLCCLSVATRETMLVAVAALLVWSFCMERPRWSVRRVVPLATPFVFSAVWASALRLRLGYFPNNSSNRLGLPLQGLLDVFSGTAPVGTLLLWSIAGLAIAVAAIVWRPRDVLTWIVVAFAGFGSLFGPAVWLTNYGYLRALVPLYAFGAIVVATVVERRLRRPSTVSVDAEERREEPAGVALGGLGHVLGRSLDQDLPTTVAALGTQVDDPVR